MRKGVQHAHGKVEYHPPLVLEPSATLYKNGHLYLSRLWLTDHYPPFLDRVETKHLMVPKNFRLSLTAFDGDQRESCASSPKTTTDGPTG